MSETSYDPPNRRRLTTGRRRSSGFSDRETPPDTGARRANMMQRFEASAAQRRAQLEARGRGTPNQPVEDDQLTPAERLVQVQKSHPEYAREYRLRLVHRLLMRSIPLDQIAQQLNCSVRTIQRDRADINARLRKEASKLDMNSLLGDTMAFYREHGAMALRVATNPNSPLAARLAAIRTSMQSRKEMGQWLHTSGVFDVLKYRADESAEGNDIARLVRLAEEVLGNEKDVGGIVDEELHAEQDDIDLSLFL